MIRERQLVSCDLRGSVRGIGIQWMALPDGQAGWSAIELTGGSLHDARNSAAARAFKNVQGASNVGIDEGLRGDVGIRNRDQRCEMEDDIDIAAGFFHETSIANVTKYDVQIFSGLWRYLIEPS